MKFKLSKEMVRGMIKLLSVALAGLAFILKSSDSGIEFYTDCNMDSKSKMEIVHVKLNKKIRIKDQKSMRRLVWKRPQNVNLEYYTEDGVKYATIKLLNRTETKLCGFNDGYYDGIKSRVKSGFPTSRFFTSKKAYMIIKNR